LMLFIRCTNGATRVVLRFICDSSWELTRLNVIVAKKKKLLLF
jgi:hypothetical protein